MADFTAPKDLPNDNLKLYTYLLAIVQVEKKERELNKIAKSTEVN